MHKEHYVNRNAQKNGDHEVHAEDCAWLQFVANPIPLGEHLTCHTAIFAAKAYCDQVNGCKYCCEPCHTQ
jgi:hypothetical protein